MTWGEVGLGAVIQTPVNPSQRWEVVAVADHLAVEPGHTPWMRLREQSTGEEFTAPPRPLATPVVILGPTMEEAVALVTREMGAIVLGTRDETTGQISCPNHQDIRGLIEHLRAAHALSVNDDMEMAPATTLHGQAHNPQWPNIGKGGFPHLHES